MGQAKQKKSRYQQLLEDHPLCCLPEQDAARERGRYIKEYGRRFGYRYGYKEKEDFMISASQFGVGFICLASSGLLERGSKNIPPEELLTIFPTPEERAAAAKEAENKVSAETAPSA